MFFAKGAVCAAVLTASVAVPVVANEIELPRQMSWTAYDTGSAGFNQAVAIGGEIQKATGTSLRVLPGKNDISRTEPLRQRRVEFSATGVGGSFMAQEGAFEFSAKNWGPQPVRVVLANSGGEIGLSVAVAGDAGIEVPADMRGKRMAWVTGAPGLNLNIEAYLAHAGLTWDDVEKVEFGGYGASWTGLIEGQVDGVFTSTNAGPAYEAAAGPRGLGWVKIDPADEEGFKRMTDVAPFFALTHVTVGANIDGTDGFDGATYAYPVLTAMADTDADMVYNMTKALVELFPEYDGKAPGISGWNIDNQDFTWVVPYHDGAVAYFKEIGVWSDEAQARNDELIERQGVLKAAWDKLAEENPEDWEAVWAETRRKALADAGLQVVF
ncbi:TAXI family TRAP transporter solute-binding subunit [Paracoccus sp. SCSIO 75233]|uniref:TAXI family TRAP transporter solute-binding subunit n=1 Tax=Paracoccus sp. SCSIO 75233 TaxID=3017782 RepID=UPI0022F0CB5B|nr:TAXI family TRAP transporter solute-binding subunit [Paracoccus sp. SCSIO 75233]WBU53609.1 TAXI family TRAP transporter solute-binding subunit [Paracoccus sp. SCSIO 75233]